LSNLATNDVGSYDLVATNWAGGTTSAPARLTLIKLCSPMLQHPALQINGVGNYRVDYQNTLASGNWTVWTNLSMAVVGQQQVIDLSASNRPARFYRVVPQ
jgi:hypothetical protein